LEPKIGDKVIVWKDNTLWVGKVTNHTEAGRSWHSGHFPEAWEMIIEDCEKGKSHNYWVGKKMTFKREDISRTRMFCVFTDEKYEQVKAATKVLHEAKMNLMHLLEN